MQRWALALDPAEHPGAPAVDDGVLYLPSSRQGEGDTGAPRVRAVDVATGEVRWETELLPGLDLQWAAPAVAEHLVVVTDTLSHPGSAPTSWVHALDRRTGAVAWRVDLNDAQAGFHESPLLAADGVLAVASKSAIIGIDVATGQERWRREGRSLPQLIEVVDGVLHANLDGLAVQVRMADGATVAG